MISPTYARLPRLGLWSVGAYAFSAFLSTAAAQVAYALFVLAALSDRGFRSWVARDTFARSLLLVAAWVLLETWRGAWLLPETLSMQWKDASGWLRLLAMLPLAWWVGGEVRTVGMVMLLAVAGWITGAAWKGEWAALLSTGLAYRTGFGSKIVFNGMLAAIVLVGCMLLAPRWLRTWRYPPVLPGVVLASITAFALLAVVTSQSRGVWLALALVAPPALLLSVRKRREGAASRLRRPALAMVALSTLMILLLAMVSLSHRPAAEHDATRSLLGGTAAEPDGTSVAYRYHLLRFGVEAWLERPFLGWGTGSTRWLVQNSGRPELARPAESDEEAALVWFDHLHNTPIEVLVRFGLVGAGLFLLAGTVFVKRVRAACQSGRLPEDMGLFLLAGIALYAVSSMTDFRLLHGDNRALLVLLFGLAYGLTLDRRTDVEQPG